MELNTDILRLMIKEEIQRSLLLEMKPEEEEAAGTIVGILSRLAAEDMDTDGVMNAAQQQFKAASAAAGAVALLVADTALVVAAPGVAIPPCVATVQTVAETGAGATVQC